MMNSNFINSHNFDKLFQSLFETKKEENVIKGQFDLESLAFSDRLLFIIKLTSSIKSVLGITYKILFWENDTKIKSFFNSNFPEKRYTMKRIYRGGKIPGIIFVDDDSIDTLFFEKLLRGHFNFEMANEPSFNGRLQICIPCEQFIILLDIYDDRGFYIYFKSHTISSPSIGTSF